MMALLRRSAVCLSWLLLACSQPGPGEDSATLDADATVSDTQVEAGDAGPRLGFTFSASAQCAGNAPIASCPVSALVIVQIVPGGVAVDDANVTVNGQALRAAGGGGLYQAVLTSPYTASFDVTVMRGSETVSDSTHAASDFTATLSPATPVLDMPLDVTWTPTGETGVAMDLSVTGPAGSGSFGMEFGDTGMANIPATVFSASGTYSIHFYRRFFTRGTVGTLPTASPRNAGIDRVLTTTIP